MASKVGTLIKEARTKAGLTQDKLAKKIPGLSAEDISAAERGVKVLTQDQLKAIAKATGVTQASLLNAAKESTAAAAKKPAATAAKKTTAANAKKTAATAKKTAEKPKTPANAGITMRVTSTEKKLIELYRQADSNAKKSATAILKGESGGSGLLGSLLGGSGSGAADSVADFMGDLVGGLLNGKK